MKILFATSEATPFAKTGGLADVAGALPRELESLGEEISLIMPAYRAALNAGQAVESTGITLSVMIGSKAVEGELLRSKLPGSNVTVYLVRQDDYFDRAELYRQGGEDYIDNCERFVFFSRAVLETMRLLKLEVDLIHCNDWQTGLIPAYLSSEYSAVPGYEQTATLLTIHNMSYQGNFWHWDMLLTGLDWKYFNWQQMEFHGRLNLLKTGLVFANALNTVSPRYAEEIQTPHFGCGLEGVLSHRREVLSGILNGVDYNEWNPATDPHLAKNYDLNSFQEGKAACKAALQQELNLPIKADVPLIGFVGRLDPQKGIDLISDVIQVWGHSRDAQFAILGTGEPRYEEQLRALGSRLPGKVGVRLAFSEALAHRIEAGSDLFLMPSRYEPCGLNQMYSLRYGAVPVVRATGGLADTITDYDEELLDEGQANGFSFQEISSLALSESLERACGIYAKSVEWRKLVANGMAQDWSWRRSAREYVELYRKVMARKKNRDYAAN